MNDPLPVLPEGRPDHRLIIEKGGYRPDQGGRTLPPMRRTSGVQDGYRPTTGGPTTPQVQPQPASTPVPATKK